MFNFNSPLAPRLRLMQAIGCGVSAVFAIGLLLFGSSGLGSSVVPIVQAAPDQSFTLHSQIAITTYAYLPLIWHSTGELVVDPQSREASLNFYLEHYAAWETAAADWTGDHNSCTPGSTRPDFRNA